MIVDGAFALLFLACLFVLPLILAVAIKTGVVSE